MGSRGPVPKRDAERRRRNKPDQPTETIETISKVRVPRADPDWCSRARRLWNAAKRAAVSQYYEATDWEVLAYACDLMTSVLTSPRPSAQMVSSLNSILCSLGLTEGDRRRMRIEVVKKAPVQNAAVARMDEYRRARQG